MKENWMKYEVYDHVISLGDSCQVAYQLGRLGLRYASYPFDWLFTIEDDIVLNALDTDFSEWLLKENLVEEISNTEHLKIIDKKYGAIHQHIFPKEKTWEESYGEVKQVVDKRVKRLLSLKGKKLLFVRVNLKLEKIKELEKILVNMYGNNIHLLVLQETKEFAIQKIELPLLHTEVFEIYSEKEGEFTEWRGYDYHWDLLFQKVRLKEENLNLSDKGKWIDFYECEMETEGSLFRWSKEKSTVDFRRFAGGSGKIRMSSPMPISVFVFDAAEKLVDVVEVQQETEYEFDITYETRFLTIKPEITWSPREKYGMDDDRMLGVRVDEIRIYRKES